MATKNDTSSVSSSSYESSSDKGEQISTPSGPSATTLTKATLGLQTKPSSSQEEEEHCGEQSSEEDVSSSESKKEQTPSKAEIAKEKKICVSSEEEEESSEEDVSSSESKKEQTPSKAEMIAEEKKICVSSSKEEEEDSSGEESSEEDEASLSKEEVSKKKETPSKAEIAKEKEICVSGKAHKRVSEGSSSEDMHATKKVKTSGKKLVPPRLWTEEDEVRLLERILEFRSATGKTYLEDKDGFYHFIKESFTVKVTFLQCMSKITKLKKKYQKRHEKGKKLSTLKPLDLKAFELYGKIWVNPVLGTNTAEDSRSDGIQKLEGDNKNVMNHGQGGDWFCNSVLLRMVAYLGRDEDAVKMDWGRVSEEKKREMMDRWRVLKAKDDETLLQKSAFLDDIVSLIYR
ncbi:PREDICTED: transcription factor STKL2-like [Camelina sativa]|uniref:Transcription factor STKL2-like n=1 Tax=Camelina sativa TaxID=90675 RepID=A0ABM0U6X4_CAMSA|nr:PREDICTED: transcription factor STKL2-like [Camelina sativa]